MSSVPFDIVDRPPHLPRVPTPPTQPQSLPSAEGMRVVMSRLPGFTKKGLLLEPFLFQCPPIDDFTRQFSYDHQDYETLRAGQHSRPAGMQLRQVSFSTLFVDYGAPFVLVAPLPLNWSPSAQAIGPDVFDMMDELEAILESGTPFRLIVANPTLWDKNQQDVQAMPATLRTMEIVERAGEVDARYLNNVSFTEFRHPKITWRHGGTTGGSNAGTTGTSTGSTTGTKGTTGLTTSLPTSATVESLPTGQDTMAALATEHYGSASKWTAIAQANGLSGGSGDNIPANGSLKEVFGENSTRKILIPAL